MRSVLMTLTMLCGSFAYAADCYMLLSYSSATYRGAELDYHLPEEGEYVFTDGWTETFSSAEFSYTLDIPDHEETVEVSHYDERVYEDTHSEPGSIGGGCRVSENVYLEGMYQYDMQASIGGRVGYVFETEDTRYKTDSIPYTATVSMESFSGSMIGVLPLDEMFLLTARVGVLRGDVEYAVKFPGVPGVHVFDRDTIWMPILGAGAMLQLHERVSVGLEYLTYDVEGTSSLIMGMLRFDL